MSQILSSALRQTQAAYCLPKRLLSTNILAANRVIIAPRSNDLKGVNIIHNQNASKFNNLEIYHTKPNYLQNTEQVRQNLTLLTEKIARPIKEEPSDNKPVDEEANKVLSARDVVDKENKASLEQLNLVADHMTRHLPYFFSSPHPFNLYSREVVLIDKVRSVRVQGLTAYTLQVALLKVYHALCYSKNKFELLNLVKDPDESCIKIRWRIVSKPGLIKFMLTFYKYHKLEVWKDAISTLYVNKEGKIYCHVCDNIDVEKDDLTIKKVVKNPLVNRGVHV